MMGSRRSFLKTAAASAAAWNIIPARVLGKDAPSNRIAMAMIGVGGMGQGNMSSFLGMKDVIVRMVCDVNTSKTEQAKQKVDKHYGNSDCLVTKDFREVCARGDIDAVMIATPDHWHAYVGTFAARHGKDIYGEKPFTHDLREGRALVRAVEQHGRIWQTGSWQRSSSEMRRAVELVRNGRIGKIARVEVGLPPGGRPRNPIDPHATIPKGLDWDFWLGPAPYRPYQGIADWDWRWVLDWGGGQMMDWIGHHADIAQWGLDRDTSGPVTFEGYAPFEVDGICDSPKTYRFSCRYADGVEMTVADSRQVKSGTTWYGENGEWVWVDRGRFDASTPEIRDSRIEPGELRLHSPGHHRNFIDCVKTRATTLTPAEVAHRSASIGHLGQIAMLTGRKIKWDPVREQILGDVSAEALLGRTPRGPWSLV
ncbi:MAG TPA: Gfo/Idh/MocA family oxidoreductase [Kiritimatiellia bacterium]|mgnify:FL=1|jgi:predicted dehydrogenase|nr:Gfo/Idh/MocA family oxidoreductase [Kiritimatiellia bacterium]HPC49256.1 Gfo/Idh/MocA family oxidoreductase [Kiritimatiellia bacterium]HPK37655.1 Gfo/Idh/MocA family oxidoreductase [Kiritimatiellia bacterium]HRU19696.1 Gfo/Idh/MocA family oxidoreductase [Kiritimatiellia bacterium]